MDEYKEELRLIDEKEQQADAEWQAKKKALADQRNSVIAKMMSAQKRAEPPMFDDNERTVQWESGCKKLSKQRYKILDALYFAENQMLTLDALETAGWGETEYGTKHGTLKTAVCRLGTDLVKANSPFLIESVLSDGGETMEVSDVKGVRKVKIRRSLVGYKLVSRVTGNCNACGRAGG